MNGPAQTKTIVTMSRAVVIVIVNDGRALPWTRRPFIVTVSIVAFLLSCYVPTQQIISFMPTDRSSANDKLFSLEVGRSGKEAKPGNPIYS